MKIFDRIMTSWNRKQITPRVVQIQPGQLKIEARGCTIVIDERWTDRLNRECTRIFIHAPGGEYQLIASPSSTDIIKDRYSAQMHVVKLKKPVVREAE